MSRHDQLKTELAKARKAHNAAPTEQTFRAMRHAANHLKQWHEQHEKLSRQRHQAAMLYRTDEVARLDKELAAHALPHNPVGEVKLVDTAGSVRLDLNGRRVFMTKGQALELFLRLGSALDDGETNEFPVDFDPGKAAKLAIELAAMTNERNAEVAA